MAIGSTSTAPARSVAAGLVAALLPILALACAGGLLVALFDGDLVPALMNAAPLGFAVIGVAGTAVLVLGVLLFFAGWRGTPVPSGVLVAIASGPWAMGVLATLASAVRVRGAVPYASPDMRANLMAAGISEVLFGVTAGAWLSGALLVACGLGLAIAALARRHDSPVALRGRLWPALLAAAIALSTVALPFVHRDAIDGWLLALPALIVAALALTLAAAFVGRDGRSGAQAAGATFASLLGVTGWLLAVRAHSIGVGFQGAAHADPASRGAYLSQGLGASVVGMDLVVLVALALGVTAVLVAALAVARSPRRLPLVAGGIAALLAALVILGADRYVEATLREDLSAATAQPWDREEGFLPAHGGGLDVEDAPHALVTREELVPHAGDAVALSDPAALDASLARLREGGPPRWTDRPEAPPIDDRWQELLDEPPELEAADVRDEPELVLAFDARVERSRWGAVLAAAARVGFHSVSLLGQRTPEVEGVLARDPVWMRLARGPAERERFLLETALRPGAAERDPLLWHGAVDTTDALRVERRGGEDPQHFAYGRIDWRDRDRLDDALVYLRPGDDVSPSRLLEAARLVRELGGRPVLVLGEYPGHPERALAPPAPEAGGDSGPTRGRITVGEIEDEAGAGVFDSTFVARTIRMRAPAIQSCYERELAHAPTLAGRVLVRFTVQPSGSVSGVTAAENTTGSDAVAACATSTIGRLRFNPGPEGGSVTFAYPFVFAPQQEPD